MGWVTTLIDLIHHQLRLQDLIFHPILTWEDKRLQINMILHPLVQILLIALDIRSNFLLRSVPYFHVDVEFAVGVALYASVEDLALWSVHWDCLGLCIRTDNFRIIILRVWLVPRIACVDGGSRCFCLVGEDQFSR